jgi:hypothetical protein
LKLERKKSVIEFLFIFCREPLHTDEDGEEVKFWDPIDPESKSIKLLAITKNPKMIPFPKPYLHRINFWNSLKIPTAIISP